MQFVDVYVNVFLCSVCINPFDYFIIKGRAVFAVAHFFFVLLSFYGFGLDIFPLLYKGVSNRIAGGFVIL